MPKTVQIYVEEYSVTAGETPSWPFGETLSLTELAGRLVSVTDVPVIRFLVNEDVFRPDVYLSEGTGYAVAIRQIPDFYEPESLRRQLAGLLPSALP